MKIFEYIILILLSFIFTLLDVSFFSIMAVFNSSILLAFQFLLVLTLLDLKKQALYYASFTILFYTIFSSIPVYALFILLFGLPLALYLVKTKIALNQESIFWIIISAMSFNFLVDLLLLIIFGSFSFESLLSILFFVITNSAVAIIVYFLVKVIVMYLNIGKK